VRLQHLPREIIAPSDVSSARGFKGGVQMILERENKDERAGTEQQ
jgi:hypothetical protein